MKCIKHGAHMTYEDRKLIEALFNRYCDSPHPPSLRVIAKQLGLAESTLRRELPLGCPEGIYRIALPALKQKFQYFHYNAERAQAEANRRAAEKGPIGKLTNHTAKDFELRLQEWRSISATWHIMKEGYPTYLPCLRTFYKHAHLGTFSTVVDGYNCFSPQHKKRLHSPARPAKNNVNKRTKDDLPKSVKDGTEPGYYELDTVHSGADGEGALLTMVAPFCNHLPLVRYVSDLRQETIHRALRSCAREAKTRGNPMRYILTDNGTEFLDTIAIQRICHALVYYTKAYAGYEKGAVENLNKLIRRTYPKGFNFSTLKPKDIRALQEHLRNYPRTNRPKKKRD